MSARYKLVRRDRLRYMCIKTAHGNDIDICFQTTGDHRTDRLHLLRKIILGIIVRLELCYPCIVCVLHSKRILV